MLLPGISDYNKLMDLFNIFFEVFQAAYNIVASHISKKLIRNANIVIL